MREKFENRSIDGVISIKMDEVKGIWSADKKTIVDAIISIGREYARQGFTITLRQLYYQLVSRDFIPNHDKVYKKISSIKDDIVYSGLLDWDLFEDRGRVVSVPYYEDNIKSALQRTIDSYRLDRQEGQPCLIEVWTEKDAISNILNRVTRRYTIPLVVNKGYTSSSAIYTAYERFIEAIGEGKKIKILYFGDHDPSGLDMIRDIEDRLIFMFTRGERINSHPYLYEKAEQHYSEMSYNIFDVCALHEIYEPCSKLLEKESDKLEDLFKAGIMHLYIRDLELFQVLPVGLTMQQIKQYNPPHNPAKITDPRAKNYISQFGPISWEVDALTPDVMMSIVDGAINNLLDKSVYKLQLKREVLDVEKITSIIVI